MTLRFNTISIIAALFITTPSFAAPNVSLKCGHDQKAGYPWSYCIHQAEGSTNQNVVYYLHGIYGSEYEWSNSRDYDKIYDLWGSNAPTVISVSYGAVWILAPADGNGFYDHFVNTLLPTLEQNLNIHPAHRMLMGLSMGGFNASQLYLKNHELFSKVALVCPAISALSPYSSRQEIYDYLIRTNAYSRNVYNFLSLLANYFPSEAAWSVSDPLKLAKERVTASWPPLYVSGGLQDEYGFFEGGKTLADEAKANGAKADWTPVQGYHCSFDVIGTALFFITE